MSNLQKCDKCQKDGLETNTLLLNHPKTQYQLCVKCMEGIHGFINGTESIVKKAEKLIKK